MKEIPLGSCSVLSDIKGVAFARPCETGVNIKYLANPFGIKYKLDGFELGVAPPFQIR